MTASFASNEPRPAASDLCALWNAYRQGKHLRCACGRGALALSVLTAPRTYCFQCTACAWQTGWFQSG